MLPFSHALDATRAVIADRAGLTDIATDVVWVLGHTGATVALALVLVRQQMTR